MIRMFKTLIVLLVGAIAILYLLNPTAGILEFIPDNAPIIGNLDEAGAMVILISTLSYFGIEIPSLFKRDTPKKETSPNSAPPRKEWVVKQISDQEAGQYEVVESSGQKQKKRS